MTTCTHSIDKVASSWRALLQARSHRELRAAPSTMFDHDAPPVTPQVLIGNWASAAAYAIRDFLTRSGHPYEWVDVDERRDAGGGSV